VANLTGGVVTSITVTNPGFGYFAVPTVFISGGGGSGALAVASVSNIGGSLQLGDGSHVFSSLSTSNIVDNGTLILNDPGGSLTYNGAIGGSGGVTMAGTFSLTLGGNNSYNGATSISAGSTVTANSSSALGLGDVSLPATATLNDNVAVNITTGPGIGLAGQYYGWQNSTDPVTGVGGQPPSPNLQTLYNYIYMQSNNKLSSLGIVGPGQAIITDTTAKDNGTNSAGANVEYGGNTGRSTLDGTTGNGFAPTLVRASDGTGFSNSIRDGDNWISVYQGVFIAPVAGVYTYATGSDDSSNIWLDGNLVVDNNNNQGYTIRTNTSPFDGNATRLSTLTAGLHTIVIEFSEGGGGYNFDALVQGPTGSGLETAGLLPNNDLGTIATPALTLGSLSGGGAVHINSSALSVGGDNNSTTFTGSISGSSPTGWGLPTFAKAGTGSMDASGATLSYTGSSTSGVTAVYDGGNLTLPSLPAGNTIDNGTLTVALSGPTSYSGVISGSGGLSLSGNNTLTLSGQSTYAGPTLLGGNSVKYGVANALPATSAITFGTGTSSSQIDMNGFNAAIGVPSISGTGTANQIINSSSTPVTLTITGTGASGVQDNVPIKNTAGTGAISLVITGTGSETLGVVNTYTGTTTISGSSVKIGVPGALPSTPPVPLVVNLGGSLDLNGNSLTVASLSSAGQVGGAITNSSATAATLTVTGTGVSTTYGGTISGPVTVVSNAPTSTTNLSTLIPNTNTGGVTATAGTLGISPITAGSGAVTLNGGTVDLSAIPAVFGIGGNGTGWNLIQTGSAPGPGFLAPNVLRITDNVGGQSNQLWFKTPVQPGNGYQFQFTYQDTSASGGGADGIAFVVQNSPAGTSATGGGGGSLGYIGGNIAPNVALELNIYNGHVQGGAWDVNSANTADIYTNPGAPWGTIWNGDQINFTIIYDGNVGLDALAVDVQTGASAHLLGTLPATLSTILGAPAVGGGYTMGITGATGGAQATEIISNFTYQQTSPLIFTNVPFVNNFTANAGTTSGLTVNASAAQNAYTISGNVTVPATATVNVTKDAASTANQAYSLTLSGNAALGGALTLAPNGTGAATLNLNGNVNGSTATGGSMGSINAGTGGSVVMSSSTSYNVVLGGGAAAKYDSLAVTGAVNLGTAKLTLTEANLYAPENGHTFTILTATGGITGQFVNGASITSQGTTYSITYNANNVVLQVTAVPVAQVLVFIAPASGASETAGTAFPVSVQAQDNSGNPAGGYSGTVNVADSAGHFSPTSITVANSSGTISATATFASIQTLTATASGFTAITLPITVNPGPFTNYVVTNQISGGGSSVPAGQAFLVQVRASDAFGNFVTTYPATAPTSVNAKITPTPAAGSSFPFSIPIDTTGLGVGLGFVNTVGSYTVSVADAGNTFTGTATPITVVPGAAAKLAFDPAGQPANTPTGVKLAAVQVDIQDAFGNTVTSGPHSTDSVTVSVASFAPATGVPAAAGTILSGSTLTVAAVGGVATFSNLTMVGPGVYSLAAVVPASFIGPNSSSFTVSPLQVAAGSFAHSPTGFSLAFNGPYLVNSTTPALFGSGFGATGVKPSVTLTGLATGTATVTAGHVTAVTITSSVLYTSAPTVTFTGGGGTGATATAVLKNGGTDATGDPVVSVTINNGGTGFTSAPTVTFGGVAAAGTVALNTATNSLTFVATNTTTSNNNQTPVLPDGTYIAVVHGTSATNGFQSINSGGGFLDGTNSGSPGHDFTATFVVGAAAAGDDIVWTPATADGPLQKLSAPGNNQGTLNPTNPFTGYPVYINDSTGNVSSVTGTFNFNPNLLSVTGGTTNGLLPGSTFTVTVTGPGTATFTYTDGAGAPNKGKLTGGNGSANAIVPGATTSAPALGFITATVPNSSAATPIYRAKDLLSVSGVQINGSGTIPVIGGSAVHLVAYVGDGDGNGSYSSGDAVLITRVLVSADTGFAAYPLVDPTIVADTDASGFIPSDASLQANEAGVGFPTANLANPPIPTGANVTPIGNNVDPSLSLPSNLQVGANGTVTVPVNLDDAHPAGSTGLLQADLALTYNPSLFTVSPSDVHAGSVLAAGTGWSVVPTIDQATGQIGIALSSSTPISAAIGGSLVSIDFHQIGSASGSASFQLVASVTPNGQVFTTMLQDAQGQFTLTNGATDSVVTVTAIPVSAAVVSSSLVVHHESIAVTEIGTSVAEPGAVDITVVETTVSVPVEGENVPAIRVVSETETLQVSAVHNVATLAAATGSPLVGLVFQFANTPVVNAQGSVAGQHLADQIFQALGRVTSASDATLTSAVRAFDHALAGQLMLSTGDDLDSMNWDDIGGGLDLQTAGDSTAQAGRRIHHDAKVNQTTPPVTDQQAVVDQATLDQLFAQSSEDDSDLVVADE
jgi:hypothetical protein